MKRFIRVLQWYGEGSAKQGKEEKKKNTNWSPQVKIQFNQLLYKTLNIVTFPNREFIWPSTPRTIDITLTINI